MIYFAGIFGVKDGKKVFHEIRIRDREFTRKESRAFRKLYSKCITKGYGYERRGFIILEIPNDELKKRKILIPHGSIKLNYKKILESKGVNLDVVNPVTLVIMEHLNYINVSLNLIS